MTTNHEDQGQPSEASADSARETERPSEWLMTGPPFDGSESIRGGATAADLFALVFEAPNREDKISRNSAGFLEEVLLNLADDAALIECAANYSEGMLTDVIARVANRMEYRVRVALEVDRRMRAAEFSAEQATEGGV